jgi:hypothetical protein
VARRVKPRYRLRPRFFLLLAVLAGVVLAVTLGHRPRSRTATPPSAPTRRSAAAPAPPGPVFGWYQEGVLPEALQGLAATIVGPDLVAVGGADAAGSSAAVTGFGPLPIVASLQTPVHDAAAVAEGTTLYVIGGGEAAPSPLVQAVSLNGEPPPPAVPLPMPLSDATGVDTPQGFMLVGGYTGSTFLDTVARWTPPGRLANLATLPVGLRYAAAAWYADRLIVAGGLTPAGPTAAVLAVNLATGRWTRWPPLPAPVYHAVLTVFDRHLVLVGGEVDGVPVRTVWIYDAGRRRWVPGPPLPTPTADGAAAVFQGHLWYLGGFTPSGPTSLVWIGKPLPAS